jgi:nucleoside-diphosphate-sugar epimerase
VNGKALLTGGAGFIGAKLAAALVSFGFEVDIVDDLSRGANDAAVRGLLASGKVRFHQMDVITSGALNDFGRNYDFVVQLAAIVGVNNVLQRPYETLRDNVLLQESVISFAKRQRRLERLLFTSTSEIYAGSLLHLSLPFPTPEDVPLALPNLSEARTSYMLSKIYGEAMVIHSRLPYTIVRPHNVYGPRMGMSHVIPELLKRAYETPSGGDLKVSSVNHKRCFCYIDDVVEMIVRLLNSTLARDQTFNVGAKGPEVSIQEVAEMVVQTVGKSLKIVPCPATPGSPNRRWPDMSRTERITAYSAQTSLRAGIEATYTWYKANEFARQRDVPKEA